MGFDHRTKLEQIGLSPAEAQIYLTVLDNGPLAAAEIAHETGIQRTSVYPSLCSLADKGLVEAGLGHGSKFAAVPPGEALPGLIVREEQTVSARKKIANELAEALAPRAADTESALDGTVQVIRTPQVYSDRLHHLQLKAQREVLMFVKAPIHNPRPGNPAQQKAQQRGVRFRSLYERAVLDDPRVGPYLEEWIAGGEEARIYEGELPYKLALVDGQIVLAIIVKRSGQPSGLVVNHEPFARGIAMLFDSLWKEAKPLTLHDGKSNGRTRLFTGSSRGRSASPSRRSAAGTKKDQ